MKKQLELKFTTWGGRRQGSGRKRIHSKGVAHRNREKVRSYHPLHINFKVKTHIRNKTCLKILKRAIINARAQGLKIVHFSLQSNHVHLVVEAIDNETLTRGMRSLTVTFSKRIDRGRIQLERYHLHVLKTLRETKHAIHYVLFNEAKHKNLKRAYVDQYSSLGTAKELKLSAEQTKMSIIVRRIKEISFLDTGGWMIKRILDSKSTFFPRESA